MVRRIVALGCSSLLFVVGMGSVSRLLADGPQLLIANDNPAVLSENAGPGVISTTSRFAASEAGAAPDAGVKLGVELHLVGRRYSRQFCLDDKKCSPVAVLPAGDFYLVVDEATAAMVNVCLDGEVLSGPSLDATAATDKTAAGAPVRPSMAGTDDATDTGPLEFPLGRLARGKHTLVLACDAQLGAECKPPKPNKKTFTLVVGGLRSPQISFAAGAGRPSLSSPVRDLVSIDACHFNVIVEHPDAPCGAVAVLIGNEPVGAGYLVDHQAVVACHTGLPAGRYALRAELEVDGAVAESTSLGIHFAPRRVREMTDLVNQEEVGAHLEKAAAKRAGVFHMAAHLKTGGTHDTPTESNAASPKEQPKNPCPDEPGATDARARNAEGAGTANPPSSQPMPAVVEQPAAPSGQTTPELPQPSGRPGEAPNTDCTPGNPSAAAADRSTEEKQLSNAHRAGSTPGPFAFDVLPTIDYVPEDLQTTSDDDPDQEDPPVRDFRFDNAAHFPRPQFDRAGRAIPDQGLVIYEGMRLALYADGRYEVQFSASSPLMPTQVRLQLLLELDSGHVYTLTLPPLAVVLYEDELGLGNRRAGERTISHQGYAPVVAQCLTHVVGVARRGTAQFGTGQDYVVREEGNRFGF